MKTNIVKGALLGLTAGLIATFFDSFYMLSPDTYVPAEYPALLLLTNIVFWSAFGCVAGACRYFFYCRKHPERYQNQHSWLIFFLLPFALLFGLLGRFNDSTILHPGFDSNAVFLVVLAFIVFVFLRRKKCSASGDRARLFIPELLAIIALFHFCSNVSQFTWVHTSFGWFSEVDFFTENERYYKFFNRYCTFLYGVGALIILGFYCFGIVRFEVLKSKPALVVTVVLVTTSLFAGMCYRANRAVFLEQYNKFAGLTPLAAHDTSPPVILVVLDTLRKRSLDEHPDVYKNLTALARESLVFEYCIANSSWTLPSHASMFTGFSPREHGCHGMLDSTPWFDGLPPTRPLHENFTTLAEVFELSGYSTAFISANFGALNPGYGLNQGFHVYDWYKSIGYAYGTLPFKPLLHVLSFLTNVKNKYLLPYRKAEDVNAAVDHLLRRLPSGPFFLFINYMDPHDPYMPTPRFKRFFLNWADVYSHNLIHKFASFLKRFSGEQRCVLDELLYKGDIAYLDHHVGKLFESLKSRGLYDESLIIVTSDHGELFCKHGYNAHKTPLYEGVTRVPLLIKFPHQQVTGIEQQYITLADLYPTTLTICGLPYSDAISGRAFGKPAGPVVAEFYNYDIGAHRALYDGRFKYMHFERGKPNALYDVQDDPLSDNNLVDALPEKTAEMDAMLADWVERHPPRYSEEGLKQMDFAPIRLRDDLRSLGYIQ